MSRYGRNWVEVIVKLLITATVLLGIIFGYALLGCSQAERTRLTMVGTETAINTTLDRVEQLVLDFVNTPPVEQPKETDMLIQGVGSLSLVFMYMVRKKIRAWKKANPLPSDDE